MKALLNCNMSLLKSHDLGDRKGKTVLNQRRLFFSRNIDRSSCFHLVALLCPLSSLICLTKCTTWKGRRTAVGGGSLAGELMKV